MDSFGGAGAQASISAGVLASVIKDMTGAQLISQTLDRINTSMALAGPVVNPDYQFQKDVFSAMGIGNKLDIFA